MLVVYKKLFSYVHKQNYLAYLAIFFAGLSSVLMTGALYFLYRFFGAEH